MLLFATIHGTTQQVSPEGEITTYCELLLSDPLQATRFNITRFNAQQHNQLNELKGKEVIIGLNARKTSSGADYWQMTKMPVLAQQTEQPTPKTTEQPHKQNLFGNQTKAA